MTEREFDRRVEELAGRFERRVEASADRLDRGLTRAFNGSRLFRAILRAVSLAAGVGLLAGAKQLAERNHRTAAVWCAGLGAVGLLAELIQMMVFRREQ